MPWTTKEITTEKERDPKISSGGNGPWSTVSIVTEKEKDSKMLGDSGPWTKTSVSTERVKDTNPNIYIERAENELRNSNYYGAIKEIDEAISYAKGSQKDQVKDQKIKILKQFSKKSVSLIRANNIEEGINNLYFYIKNRQWVENKNEYKQGIDNIVISLLDKRHIAERRDETYYKIIQAIKDCINLTSNRSMYNDLFNGFKAIPLINDLKQMLSSFDVRTITTFNNKVNSTIRQISGLNKEDLVKDNITYFLQRILKPNYLDINKFNIEDLIATTNMLIPFSSNPSRYESVLNNCIEELFEKFLKKNKNEEKAIKWLNAVKTTNRYKVLGYEELVIKAYDNYNKHSKLFNDILNNKISMYRESHIIFANDAYGFGEPKKAIDIVNKAAIKNNFSLELKGERIKLRSYKALGDVGRALEIYETLLIAYLNPYTNEDEETLKECYEYIIQNKRYKDGEILLNKYLKVYPNLDRDKKKLINKYLAKFDKETLQIHKYIVHKYNSSLLKDVEYYVRDHRNTVIIFTLLIAIAAFFMYSQHMYTSGKWKAKVTSAELYLEENLLVGQEISYEMKVKTKPQHIKAENVKVVSTNPEVAIVQDDKIITLNEGETEIEIYANEELITSNTINVYNSYIKSFTVDYLGDLKQVGDEIDLDINVEYVSYDVPEYDIEIESSDESILQVRGRNVEAVGVGVGDIFIRVNGEEKRLIFDISAKKKSLSSLKFKSKYEVGEEIYIDPEFYPVLTFYKKNIYGYYTKYNNVDRSFEDGYLRIFEEGKAELKISDRENPYDYRIVEFTVKDSYGNSYNNSYNNYYNNYNNSYNNGYGSSNGYIIINEPSYGDGRYIFEDSHTKFLTDRDLKGLSKETLALMRNEIFAKHGYIFKEEPYKSYFESKTWYRGTKDVVSESDLNFYELENVTLIKKYENQ